MRGILLYVYVCQQLAAIANVFLCLLLLQTCTPPLSEQAVVQALADGLPIHYNCQVTRVQWRHDGASVTCSNGQHFTADAVICTLPLGVLKVHA